MSAKVITYKDRHLLPDERAIGIFNHIPKTAGSSVEKILHRRFQDRLTTVSTSAILDFHHLGLVKYNNGLPDQTFNQKTNYKPLASSEIKPLFYGGHETANIHHLLPTNNKIFYITFLRHPFQVALSLFKHVNCYYAFPSKVSPYPNLDACLYSYKNFLIFFLGNGDKHLAEETLFEKYVFFGLQEQFDESLSRLASVLPGDGTLEYAEINISAPQNLKYSPEAETYFYENNKDDIALYNKAVIEFEKRYDKKSTLQKKYQNTVENFTTPALLKNYHVKAHELISNIEFKNYKNNLYYLDLHFAHLYKKSEQEYKNWYQFLSSTHGSSLCIKYYLFICCIRMKKIAEAKERGINLFAAINDLDKNHAVFSLQYIQLDIFSGLLALWDFSRDGPFPEQFSTWLQRLGKNRGWETKAALALAKVAVKKGDKNEALNILKQLPPDGPDSDAVRHELCTLRIDMGKAAEEERLVKEELENNPDSETALRCLALAQYAQNDFANAALTLASCLKRNPFWTEGILHLSKTYWHLEEKEQAITYAQQCVGLDRMNSATVFHYCDLLFAYGDFAQAESESREALSSNPWWGELHVLLAKIYLEKGDPEAALEEARTAVARDPEAMAFREFYANLLIRFGKFEEAKAEALAAIASTPNESWPCMQLALVYESEGEPAKALVYAKKAYDVQPHKRALAGYYAKMLRVNRQYEKCKLFCQLALNTDEQQGWAWRELCRCALEEGDRESALAHGARAIAVHPQESDFQKIFQKEIGNTQINAESAQQ